MKRQNDVEKERKRTRPLLTDDNHTNVLAVARLNELLLKQGGKLNRCISCNKSRERTGRRFADLENEGFADVEHVDEVGQHFVVIYFHDALASRAARGLFNHNLRIVYKQYACVHVHAQVCAYVHTSMNALEKGSRTGY